MEASLFLSFSSYNFKKIHGLNEMPMCVIQKWASVCKLTSIIENQCQGLRRCGVWLQRDVGLEKQSLLLFPAVNDQCGSSATPPNA